MYDLDVPILLKSAWFLTITLCLSSYCWQQQVSQYLLLWVMFLAVICFLLSANSCTRNNNGALSDSFPNAKGTIQRGMQVIVPSYSFKCCGKVAKWKIRLPITTETFNNILELQVWRPSTSKGLTYYNLLGNNAFANFSSVNRIATLSPQPNHQIQVKPNDVIGLYVYSKSSSDSTSGAVVSTGARRILLVTKATRACLPGQICRAPAVTASLGN